MGPEGGFHEVKLVVQPGVFLLIVSEDGEPTFMRVLDDDTVRVPEKYGETWPWPPVSLPRARAIGEAWRSYSADGDTNQLRRLFVD
jgi:hypothetical protein